MQKTTQTQSTEQKMFATMEEIKKILDSKPLTSANHDSLMIYAQKLSDLTAIYIATSPKAHRAINRD